MAQIDWRFMQPLDQSNQIAALGAGNQQINAGLAVMGGAVTGYADALKQRNTDEILNALYQAQNTGQLPDAMAAVANLQQQYGRGFDQAAVRNAVDARGSTLMQRDLQGINLQQAQAAQAAIPQLNQMAIAQAKARGVDVSGFENAANLGIDTSSQINSFANQMVNDTRDSRDFNYRSEKDARDFNYRKERDIVGDNQWNQANDRANMDAAYRYSEGFAAPAQSGYSVNPDGTISTYSSPAVTRGDAFAALMPALFQQESGLRHRDSNGNLITSPKGASGIAQIMPATAAKPGYGMKPINLQTSTPEQQMQWATEYIGRIADKHNFTVPQALAAYNAGPGAVQTAIDKAKKSGGDFLQYLPKETQQYVPSVLNRAGQGSAQRAVGAVGGLSQAGMAKITGGYNEAIAKLNADFNNQSAKDQTKGSLAATGKNVDTWAAGKKDSGLIFAGNKSFFTSAGDLAGMAKKDPAFNKLPESAQINVLEGAYAKMNDVNFAQYVPDGDLKKFINEESQNYQKSRVSQFNQQKEAAFENAYQSAVREFRSVGQQPPSREGFRQLVDPQAKPAPKQSQSSPAQKAVAAVAPKSQRAGKAPSYLTQGAAINSRGEALSQARERATGVANLPTRKELDQLKQQAIQRANTKREEEEARKAFEKLKKADPYKPMSPEMKKLLERHLG